MNVKLPQYPQECMNCFLVSYIWDRSIDTPFYLESLIWLLLVSSTKVSVESML